MYWTTRSFIRSFTRTAHYCSAPLALLACSAMLICSLACSFTHSISHGKVNGKMSQNDPVLSHSALIYLKIHSSRRLFIVIYPNTIPTTKHPPLPERLYLSPRTMTLWSRKTKNPDVSTGPLAYPFAHSLARGKVNF